MIGSSLKSGGAINKNSSSKLIVLIVDVMGHDKDLCRPKRRDNR